MKKNGLATARGSTLCSTLSFLHDRGGAVLVANVLGRLNQERRAQVEATRAADEVPYEWMADLLVAADAELGPSDPLWSERAGEFAIASLGQQRYGGILRKASPLEFLTQPVSLFRLYYHPGDMDVVEQGEGRAVLRLVGFDRQTPLFCARQTGGLRAALASAGGRGAAVKHVRCAAHGDAFCEWELRWQQD